MGGIKGKMSRGIRRNGTSKFIKTLNKLVICFYIPLIIIINFVLKPQGKYTKNKLNNKCK